MEPPANAAAAAEAASAFSTDRRLVQPSAESNSVETSIRDLPSQRLHNAGVCRVAWANLFARASWSSKTRANKFAHATHNQSRYRARAHDPPSAAAFRGPPPPPFSRTGQT